MKAFLIILLAITTFALVFIPPFYLFYRIVFGQEIAKFPLKQSPKGEHILSVNKSGYYAIWLQGKLWHRSKYKKFPLRLYDRLDNLVKTHYVFSNFRKNSWGHGSTLLYYTKLDVGNYKVEIGGEQGTQHQNFDYVIQETIPTYWFWGVFLLSSLWVKVFFAVLAWIIKA